jgi:hypothetical protein
MEAINHKPCKYFEQENSHSPAFGEKKPWAKGDSTTGHFWCKQTMTVLGPDTGPVDPDECQSGRGCFIDS